jgi:hypothetical protein
MTTLIDTVFAETVQLNCLLKADAHKAPFLMNWVRHEGKLPSTVLAQLAEAGIAHGVALSHLHHASPTDGVDQRVMPELAHGCAKIRVRTVLHPLAHPRLIQHVRGVPPAWLGLILLQAIEFGMQIALGARQPASNDFEVKLDTQNKSDDDKRIRDAAVVMSVESPSPHKKSTAYVDDMPALKLDDLATLFPTTYT